MHIMSRVSIPLHIVISDCLLLKADICRKHIVGDSLASDKLSPSVIPCIKLVMSKRYLIATLLFLEGISISQLIDALTWYFSTFQVETCTNLHLWTSGAGALCILRHKIFQANVITVTVWQHNNPDSGVVQKATCVEKLHRLGIQFYNIFIQGDWAPRKYSWVRQQDYSPANVLFAFRFSVTNNSEDANVNGSVIWWTVHCDPLFLEGLEYQLSVMPNTKHDKIMCLVPMQRVWCFVDVSSVLTPM